MITDYAYYTDVFIGTEADEASFPSLCARAEDIVNTLTRWRVTEETFATYPALTQMLYKKAVCAQVDYFAVNGVSSLTATDGKGFTVGKVTVHDSTGSAGTARTASMVCPLAVQYLEQSGLMGPQVPTAGELPAWGVWLC